MAHRRQDDLLTALAVKALRWEESSIRGLSWEQSPHSDMCLLGTEQDANDHIVRDNVKQRIMNQTTSIKPFGSSESSMPASGQPEASVRSRRRILESPDYPEYYTYVPCAINAHIMRLRGRC